MKKRALSFLLSLAMLLPMLGTGMTASAAGNELHAYQTEKNRQITVDGSLTEPQWIVDAPVGSGTWLGALCDVQNLYFALETAASSATLSLGGKQVTANLGANPTVSMGTIAGKDGKYEIAIPLPELGLALGQDSELPLTVTAGSMMESYTLVLAKQAMVEVHRGQSATGADFASVLHKNSNASGQMNVDADGTMRFTYTGDTYDSVSSTSVPFNSTSFVGYTLSFEIDFNSLPQLPSDSKKSAAQFGLFWYMCTGSKRYDMSISTGEDGTVTFYAKQPTVAGARKLGISTGIKAGTEQAKNVRMRIMTDAGGNVTLFVNGKEMGTIPNSAYDSTTGAQFRIFTDHRNRSGSECVDVTIRNFHYREWVPGQMEVQTYGTPLYAPAEDDGVRSATAYLDMAGVRLDGDLSEAQWYLPYTAVARNGADAPAAHAGFLWDADNLYVGIRTYSNSPLKSAQFSIGDDKVAQADLTTGKATMGDLVYGFQQYEWAIPLSQLGLSARPGASGDFALSVTNQTGISVMHGKLTLSGASIVLGDTCADVEMNDYDFTLVPNTTMVQADGYYDFKSNWGFTGNEIYQYYKVVDPKFDSTTRGGYELVMDLTIGSLPNFTATRGWRGFCVEIREGLENRNPKLQTRFNLRSDGRSNVIMDILYLGSDYVSVDTGVDFGERAVFKMVVTEDLIPSLYVNDKLVYTFPKLNRDHFGIVDTLPMPRVLIQAINHGRALDSNGTLNCVNVQMHDILWTQATYNDPATRLNAALELLDEKALLAGNSADNLSTSLALPKSLSLAGTDLTYPVTWTLKDTTTGAASDRINLTTGQVKVSTKPASVTLTATISEGGTTASRSFAYQIKGSNAAGKIAFIDHDMDPRVGQAKDFTADFYTYIDGNYNSLVYDQGSSKAFNRITLYDSDSVSRASVNDFGVFISNDNKTYTKVTGWQLHQDGAAYTLYNLNETARYVKVHSYMGVVDTAEWEPSFYNAIQSAMAVSNETDLLGAKGAFAHKAELTVKGEGTDVPVKLTLADLGAKAGEYQTTYADFRFTQGSTLLAHWQDGKGNFYVRVPAFTNGTAAITAHWGNASAKDIADGEAAFEAVYGNVTSHNMTHTTALHDDGVAKTMNNELDMGALAGDGRAFTFPNGNVIVVANSDKYDLAYSLSTDGGRTFQPIVPLIDKTAEDKAKYGTRGNGFGGFMWDESVPGRQRLWMIAYSSAGYKAEDLANSDCRMCLFWTDDMGVTWNANERRYLSIQGATPIHENDIFYSNAKARPYMLTYCDGLVLKDADGAGPNVDYVVWHGMQSDNHGSFNGASIYSADGGESWYHSENTVSMPGKTGHEYGISEGGLGQLDDGSLYVLCRAQDDSNDYLYQAWSYDYGKTWSNIGPSQVISTNTHPLLTRYDDLQLLMWSGNNSLGGNARQRLPMSLGISTDNYKSYDKFLNLTLGTDLDTHKDSIRRMTQPSLFFSPDGNEAFICWTNLRGRPYNDGTAIQYHRSSEAFLIEEFDEMIYGTKGAYDDFETTSWKSEGWGVDDDRDVTISTDRAVTGSRSLKLTDSFTKPVYATRMIPSVRSGSVGASVFVPSGNTTDFVMELKAGYNYTYLKHTIAGFGITPDGNVYIAHDSGKIAAGTVKLDRWNDFAIHFDMAAGKGTLYINGVASGEFATMAKGNEVTAVEFGAPTPSKTAGSHIYVDNFFVTEADLTSGTVHTQFNDVANDAWYKEAVYYAVDNKIMSGYNAATFGPNDTLSRAMVVQVLYNKEGQPAVSGAHKFPDVPATQWFNNAVTWGSAKKVVSGYGDGRFGPNDSVTIEQVAVILWNYSGTPAAEADLTSVGTHSDWAANALRWATANKLLEGVPYEAVTGKATRAQTAQILMNYLSK
ncbi:MAG: S-layer homology domain-containing protein [Oscillospiraceae bacterium]|nr:S-layer homology domain-containing protein [Oscillospiraceae bacterium]